MKDKYVGKRKQIEQFIKFFNFKNIKIIDKDATTLKSSFFHKKKFSLAYFDMALYEPTKAALEAIQPHLLPGSIIMLDEFNNRDYPGETIAFKEVFKDIRYKVKKSKFMTDRTFIIVE